MGFASRMSSFISGISPQIRIHDTRAQSAIHPKIPTFHLEGKHQFLTCGVAQTQSGRFAVGFTDYLFTNGHRGTFEAMSRATGEDLSLLYGGELFIEPLTQGLTLREGNSTSGFLYTGASQYFDDVQNSISVLRELAPALAPYLLVDSETRFSTYDERRTHLDDRFNGDHCGTNVRHELLNLLSVFPSLSLSPESLIEDIRFRNETYESLGANENRNFRMKIETIAHMIVEFLNYGLKWQLIQESEIPRWASLASDVFSLGSVMESPSRRLAFLDDILNLTDEQRRHHVLMRLEKEAEILSEVVEDRRNHRYDIILL